MSSSDLLSLANQGKTSERLFVRLNRLGSVRYPLYLFKLQFLPGIRFSISEESHTTWMRVSTAMSLVIGQCAEIHLMLF